MGLQILLSIHEWKSNADINAINADLMKDSPGIIELYDEYTIGQNGFDGMFKKKGKKILIFSREEGQYVDYYSEVWSCFDNKALKSIAKHVTDGRIVFHVDVEGNPDEYWILENGKHRAGKLMVV